MQFERERLMTMQNKESIDTFEKFINFKDVNEDERVYGEIDKLEKQVKHLEVERNKRVAKQLSKLDGQSSNGGDGIPMGGSANELTLIAPKLSATPMHQIPAMLPQKTVPDNCCYKCEMKADFPGDM